MNDDIKRPEDLVGEMPESLVTVSDEELLPAVLEPPQGVSEGEARATEQNAEALVQAVLQSPEERAALRGVSNVGHSAQNKAGEEFKLLRTSLGKVMERMKKTGQSTSIPSDLAQLRKVMDEINPYPAIEQMKKARTAGFFSRMFRSVPGVGAVLADIARRYESVQTQVDVVIQSLESGTDKLLENSLELEERYKNLKGLQQAVKLGAYELRVLLRRIEDAKAAAGDELQRQALEKAEAKAMRRLQNLVVTEHAFAQYFVTINATLNNHENLRDAVRSMVDLVRPVLENGLALQVAQQEERQIAQALEATQDYLGGLLEGVAEESMDNAAEVARVANQPLANFKDLVRSYNILATRMDEAQQIESRMMENARQNLSELETITRELEERAETQEAGREAARKV